MTFLYGMLYISLPMILTTVVAVPSIEYSDKIENDFIALFLVLANVFIAFGIGMYISEYYIKVLAYQ